jgi:protein phosphatase
MIVVEQPHIYVRGGSSRGIIRDSNEDHFTFTFFQAAEHDPTPIALGIVADGVGGQPAGEVAARIAVDMIVGEVEQGNINQPITLLKDAIHTANEKIFTQGQSNPAQTGMACTCACALLIDKRLFTSSVGDSRIYLFKDRKLHQISRDHTYAWESNDQQQYEQAVIHRDHPLAHVLTRWLGEAEPPLVDARFFLSGEESDSLALNQQGFALGEEDLVLICSDGLTDMLENSEIEQILQNTPANTMLEKLIYTAERNGGEDNITVILMGGKVT